MRGAVLAMILITVPTGRLSPADEAKIRAVDEAYSAAWRRNDPEAVRATLWPDAVLIPQGNPPVLGLEAIDRFWWPKDGPATTVPGFTLTVDESVGAEISDSAVGASCSTFPGRTRERPCRAATAATP